VDTACIAHLSDLHFGKIAHPGIVNAIVQEVNTRDLDLVAISGDLTQRARKAEYKAASSMLRAFEVPFVVVPGNHDVYPWWRPIHRLLMPLRRYHRHISEVDSPTFHRPGLAVLGINSAHGRTVKGGRIGSVEQENISEFFERLDTSVFKVLVVHHHLTQIQALGPHDVARNARKALQLAGRVGVDLILCGHLHVSHIEPIEIMPENYRVVIASAGTATSSRGRGERRMTNFYNVISIDEHVFTVEERRYDPDEQIFVSDRTTRFERV